jgi:hypothetical protein
MKYKGIIKKSRTYDYAALLAVFGAVLQSLPMLQDMLEGHYGVVFMVVSMIVAFLRHKTSGPVGAK